MLKSTDVALDTYTEYPSVTLPNATLSFSISDNSIGFGALNSSTARYATGDQVGSATETEAYTLTASTNATSGYTLSFFGDTLSNGLATLTAIGGANAASSPGTEQFGLRATVSSGTGTVSNPYAASGFAYAAGASTSDELATGLGDAISSIYSLRYIANISTGTESGSYSTTLNFVVTGNF